MSDDAIERALHAVMSDATLWNNFTEALKPAEGLDHDFPEEDFVGPVGRLHRANARLLHAGRLAEPFLVHDWRKGSLFFRAAYDAAAGVTDVGP